MQARVELTLAETQSSNRNEGRGGRVENTMSTTIGATPLGADRQPAAAILARLDRLPATRHIWLMVTLLSLGGMFEFYDLFMTGYVIPGLVKAGLLTGVSIGMFSGPALFVASTFFGLF